MNDKYCVYKVSPSGIRAPLYYGTETDCKNYCREKDYDYTDENQIVWYLEVMEATREKDAY